MIEHIPEIVESGITSLKLEGRVKTSYYVATVVKAYREELDRYIKDPENYKFDPSQLDELCKVSHRPYSTGFYYGKPSDKGQVYTSSSYIREYDLIGMVEAYDESTGIATISQRNRFFVGDEIEVMQPGKPFFTQKVEWMENEKGERIDSAPHAQMVLKIPMNQAVSTDAILRKKREEK